MKDRQKLLSMVLVLLTVKTGREREKERESKITLEGTETFPYFKGRKAIERS